LKILWVGSLFLLASPAADCRTAERPAACNGAPWFKITARLQPASLPPGVQSLEKKNDNVHSLFRNVLLLANPSKTPLFILTDSTLLPQDPKAEVKDPVAAGARWKIQSGVVYAYYADGAPFAGKTQLKGWVPWSQIIGVSGSVEKTRMPQAPEYYQVVLENYTHQPELWPKQIKFGSARPAQIQPPDDDSFYMNALYEGKVVAIQGSYHYSLNERYDPGACD